MENYRDLPLGGRLTPFQGTWPRLEEPCYIFHGAQIIGNVSIGKDSSIWHNCVLRGDVHFIRVGTRTNIQDGTVIHVTTGQEPTIIGNDVLIAHKTMLHGCEIGDRGFVGMNSIVMDGCVIEADGMLAAGSMLTPGKKIKTGELWMGSPAKFMRHLTPEEISRNGAMAEHYRLLAVQHTYDAAGEEFSAPYPKLG